MREARRTCWGVIWLVAAASASSVRLPECADVGGPLITLGAIAEIQCTDEGEKKALASLELGPAPLAGESNWIDMTQIKDLLHARGFSLSEVEFVGSRRVEVRGAASPVEPMTESPSAASWRGELVQLIRRSLNGATFPEGEGGDATLRIRVEGDRAISYLVEHPHAAWTLIVPERWSPGWQLIELEVSVGGDFVRLPLRVEIAVAPRVVTARLPINRGSIIEIDDVTLVSFEDETNSEDLATDLSTIIGQEAKRDLPAGEPIRVRDVQLTPVVFRGQPVTVSIHYRSAWLQKTFLAADDAGLGEWIEVYEADGGRGRTHDYQVRVTGPHRAELPINAPPSRSASRPQPSSSKPARTLPGSSRNGR